MPNAKVLEEKKAIVAELAQKLKGAAAGVLVDYKGISVAEDTALRADLRKSEIDYAVVKNTLTLLAAKDAGLDALEPILNGTTALAVSMTDPIAPAKHISDFAKKMPKYFEIKGGFMDGKVISVDEVKALAAIPPIPVLRAQVLGTMLAPVSGLAFVLSQIAEQKGGAPAAAAAE